MKRALIAFVVFMFGACTGPTAPSTGNSFQATRVDPKPGTVFNSVSGGTITISGPLAVSPQRYYALLFVRDDGVYYVSTEEGPTTEQVVEDDAEFRQGVGIDAYLQARLFGGFCRGHSVTHAVLVVTERSTMTSEAFRGGMVIASDAFDPQSTEYRAEVPLNYRCQ